MPKKPKDPKAAKYHAPATISLIRRMLKRGKSKRYIAAHFGFDSKATRYIIDRWGLDENLVVPRLIGIR